MSSPRRSDIEVLRQMLPTWPEDDAPCHRGLVPQHECRQCMRIKVAHMALDRLSDMIIDLERAMGVEK